MSLLKKLTPDFLRGRYLNIQKRLQNLELEVRHLNSAVDTMLVSPRYVPADEIGFNGQKHRKKIFADIMGAASFDAIIETGTWLGNTTGFMHLTSGKPVYSCELNPRFAALSRMRLADMDQVHLQLGDSRKFLQALRGSDLATKTVFIYLDAHWYDDLPLAEEMEIIGSGWKNYVVLIDDFQVPDDREYYYDNYGEGKALELSLLSEVIRKNNLAVFFPQARCSEETGGCCGCVVLVPRGELSQKLAKLPSLREWKMA
jgi:hypothetical protein